MEQNDILNEDMLKVSDLITIDPFYSISQYNEALHALENNGIEYQEWISTLNPYHFYLDLDGNKPIMMNYEKSNRTEWIKMVSKVKPLIGNDEVLLHRRGDKTSDIKNYINNDVFNKALKADDTIVFNYLNREQLFELSKSYGIIYPIGKYLKGAKRLAICFDKKIKNVLSPNMVELEMGKHKLGQLEMTINYEVLRNKDKIVKWARTPHFRNGKLKQPSPISPLKF